MASGIVTTGGVDDRYVIVGQLGVVGCHVDNKDSETRKVEGCGGCGGGDTQVRVYVPIEEVYNRGARDLLGRAQARGANAVIHARFEHRVALEALANPTGQIAKVLGQKSASDTVTSQVIELFCYGTAVIVEQKPQ